MDRSQVNRMLAKTLAYIECGKMDDASVWASELVDLLVSEGVRIDRLQ